MHLFLVGFVMMLSIRSHEAIHEQHVRYCERCQTDEDHLQEGRLDADAGRLLSQHHQSERPGEQGKHHRGLGDTETRDRGLKHGTHG